ncbi:unnamed protein product [Arabis nemorensis]|uniref:Uncharacterized protein n=1 Tax=Arabis nemorensis TaxID=586526 RepID=A0A565CH09_9BRAS|nr:unnamed protein product [Arabis nemorensis]
MQAYLSYALDNSLVAAISTSYNFTHTGKMGGPPAMAMEWQGAPASPSSYTVKRILRLDRQSWRQVAGLHQEAAIARLALLNSNLREESPGPSGSVSPFNSNAMKRPKTGR